MKTPKKSIASFLLLTALAILPCRALELITNGDFETGDFTGWTVANQGDFGSFRTATPGANTNIGFGTDSNGDGGNHYALSDDQFDSGAHVLLQTFTISSNDVSVILSFQMFVNAYSLEGNPTGAIIGNGLGFDTDPNLHARVDILSEDATAFTVSTGVLANLYLGASAGQNGYTSHVIDITSIVGTPGTYQLRFAEVDNGGILNQGVDNVSISVSPVPEPASLWMLGLGAAALAWRSKQKASSVACRISEAH